MDKNPLPDDLKKSFDDTIVLLNAMIAEAAGLKEKFGATSKLYRSRLEQIETIRSLYKKSSAYIEHMLNYNIKLGAVCIVLDLELVQEKYSMTFGHACKVLDIKMSQEKIDTVDRIDKLIKDLNAASYGGQ